MIYRRKVHTTHTFFTPTTHEIRGMRVVQWNSKFGSFSQTQVDRFSDSHEIIGEIFQVKWLCTYVPVHHELFHHVAEVI